ncbi:MAG: DUF3634 family protein [Labilithrix sp.]|nr:DUF3634 family protein [Labilithrix sp.]MBX3223467.1 DUF3634 family protein [Labilithrix sp.]
MDATLIAPVVLVIAAIGALYVAARRAVTIAELDIERGSVRVVRGGIAPPILADLRDVAKRPPLDGVTVRILRSSGRAEVELVGNVPADQAQRIRNVIGRVPIARLVNAPRRR